jgi:hydrogenase expression/formation protein HypC
MCLAFPLEVLAVDGPAAVVDHGGERRTVSLLLLDEPVAPGDYLLIQVGNFAFQRMTPTEGREARALLAGLAAAG